jgi:hypothetical protein
VANPYRKPFLDFLPTGTCTLQDAPSFARRDNAKHKARRLFAVALNAVVERSRYAAEKNPESVYTPIFAQFRATI